MYQLNQDCMEMYTACKKGYELSMAALMTLSKHVSVHHLRLVERCVEPGCEDEMMVR